VSAAGLALSTAAQPLAQHEPVRRFERLEFSVRVQPHLRQAAEEVRKPFCGGPALCGSTSHTRASCLRGGEDARAVRAELSYAKSSCQRALK